MPWWEQYFGELYLRILGTSLEPDETVQEVAAVMTMLRLRPGARVLDLACGQGRHAVPLARAGYRMTGLDRSAFLLNKGQRAGRAVDQGVGWTLGDMRHLPFGQKFDACICMFTSFGYFDKEEENEQVLDEICRVLKRNGTLILDVANRDYYLLRAWPYSWRRHGQAIVLEESLFNPETSRFTMTFTWLEDGRAESLTHSVRHYLAPELQGMLRRAGMVPKALYGDWDASPFGLDSQRLIVVAKKA